MKNTGTLIGIIAINIICITANAQSLEREVISAFGNNGTSSTILLSGTAGETITETFITGSFHLTQGFHQPTQSQLSVKEKILPTVNYKLYPNPATYSIILELITPPDNDYRFAIYAVTGQLMTNPETVHVNEKTYKKTFDISVFAPGSYYLHIASADGHIYKALRFVKN